MLIQFGLDLVDTWPKMVSASLGASQHGARLGGGGAIDISLGRIIVSFVICIMVAVLAILLIRQRGGKIDLGALISRMEQRGPGIEVVETRRLSTHADICVVRQGGREYLLLLQQGGTQILRDEPVAPATDMEPPCA